MWMPATIPPMWNAATSVSPAPTTQGKSLPAALTATPPWMLGGNASTPPSSKPTDSATPAPPRRPHANDVLHQPGRLQAVRQPTTGVSHREDRRRRRENDLPRRLRPVPGRRHRPVVEPVVPLRQRCD